MTTTKDNIVRIKAALASDETSNVAKNYLNRLIESYENIQTVAALTFNHEIGLNVIEYEDPELGYYVHYGDYSDGSGDYGCTHCDIEAILDVIESGDAMPNWFEEDWMLVTVKSNNACGYEMETRGSLPID